MTCQLAFSSSIGSVMFSDSQVSTHSVEYHGVQKQFVGEDFLLGGAGHGGVIAELFNSMRDPVTGNCTVGSTEIADHIVAFLRTKVTEQAAAATNFILVYAPQTNQNVIWEFHPSIYKEFILRGNISTLGSGAELIQIAIERDKKLGLYSEPEELVDMVVAGENYLEAATQSLTVDTQFTVGILHSDKAYLMGDSSIDIVYGPPAILQSWNDVATRYRRITAHAQQIRGEIRAAQRALSAVQIAGLDSAAVNIIEASQSSIEVNREQLRREIDDFCTWYDSLLGR